MNTLRPNLIYKTLVAPGAIALALSLVRTTTTALSTGAVVFLSSGSSVLKQAKKWREVEL